MAILIIVLKLVGIVFLLFLTAVLYILFMPHHFYLYARREERLIANFKLSSLLKIFTIEAKYDEELQISVGIIWKVVALASTNSRKRTKNTKNKTINTNKKSIEEIFELIINAKDAINPVIKFLVNIIKKSRIKLVTSDLTFSTGECDKTAFYYGLLMTIPGAIDEKINIIPDFQTDEFYINGNIEFKGYIAFIIILVQLIKLLTDKNIRKLF